MKTSAEGAVSCNGKAGSLIFVSCDVMHRDTGRTAEKTENGRCVRAVWDNLKGRFLITDLSNNRSFGREGSLNRVSFESKKISNDQELIQSDPTSRPQNQKGNN